MTAGLLQLRTLPQYVAAVRSTGGTVCENMLKQRSRRNGCIGTCKKDSAGEPQRRSIVPWITEWTNRNRDSRRNAGVERVANVSGRKRRICKTVESLFWS